MFVPSPTVCCVNPKESRQSVPLEDDQCKLGNMCSGVSIQRVVALFGITMFCTVQYCAVLYCTVLYGAVLYCTVLYCTVMYCTVLYCTVLMSKQFSNE